MGHRGWQRFMRPIIVAVGLVAILACVVGLVSESSALSERAKCSGNLAQFALAVRGYELTQGMFPRGTSAGEALPPERRLSWVPGILSWTDYYQGIGYLFERDRPWDSAENLRPRVSVWSPGEASYVQYSKAPPWFPL